MNESSPGYSAVTENSPLTPPALNDQLLLLLNYELHLYCAAHDQGRWPAVYRQLKYRNNSFMRLKMTRTFKTISSELNRGQVELYNSNDKTRKPCYRKKPRDTATVCFGLKFADIHRLNV